MDSNGKTYSTDVPKVVVDADDGDAYDVGAKLTFKEASENGK